MLLLIKFSVVLNILDIMILQSILSIIYIKRYTPEPDIIHEVLGHIPMFADSEFATLS
jgi:hypothetical protein